MKAMMYHFLVWFFLWQLKDKLMQKAFQFDTQVPDRRENMSLHNYTYIAGGFNKNGTLILLDKVDSWCLLEVRNTRNNLLFVLLNSYILTVSFPCPVLSRAMLWHIAKSFLTCVSFLNCDYDIVKLYKTNVWSIFASFCFFWPGGAEGGQHFLIWPKRVCTAEQGVVSRISSLKQGNTTSPFSIYVI